MSPTPPSPPPRGDDRGLVPSTWRGRRGLWRLILLLAIIAGIIRVCTAAPDRETAAADDAHRADTFVSITTSAI